MQFLKLMPERTLGPGHARVQVSEAGLIAAGDYRCVVQRVGRRDSFLGANGWGDASRFFTIHIDEVSESGESSFLLKPDLVQHMEASSNYEFKVLDAGDNVLGAFNVFWKGVPGYRKPKDDVAPIIGSGVDSQGGDPRGAPIEPSGGSNEGGDWGKGPIIGGGSTGGDDIGGEDELPEDESERQEPESIVAPRPAKVLVNCPLDATHQIFSDMRFCPICSRSLKRK